MTDISSFNQIKVYYVFTYCDNGTIHESCHSWNIASVTIKNIDRENWIGPILSNTGHALWSPAVAFLSFDMFE